VIPCRFLQDFSIEMFLLSLPSEHGPSPRVYLVPIAPPKGRGRLPPTPQLPSGSPQKTPSDSREDLFFQALVRHIPLRALRTSPAIPVAVPPPLPDVFFFMVSFFKAPPVPRQPFPTVIFMYSPISLWLFLFVSPPVLHIVSW